MSEQKYATWNPWHGCTKYSEGCRYCYVYRQDEAFGSSVSSEQCRKTQNFDLPVKKKRDGSFNVAPGSIVMTCFTSDFLLKDADEWRGECWKMIKSRSDCMFYFFTKRIERFMACVPADWGEGYNNVIVGCTCENQDRADFRLPIFSELPIKHKTVIIGPMPQLGLSILGIVSGAVVGVLTVLIAAGRPAKRAAKVTPVSAISGIFDEKKNTHTMKATKGIKIEKALGIRHATQSKKNLFLMIGSFALSIMLFLSFSVIVELVNCMMPQSAAAADIEYMQKTETGSRIGFLRRCRTQTV